MAKIQPRIPGHDTTAPMSAPPAATNRNLALTSRALKTETLGRDMAQS